MFAALKREFLPDLEVSDEGGYWETRDLAELIRRRTFIDGSDRRPGRRAQTVRTQSPKRPRIPKSWRDTSSGSRHTFIATSAARPNTRRSSSTTNDSADADATEKQWDELYKHNRRQQERLQRAIEELTSRGLDHKTAFEQAMREIVPELPQDDREPAEASSLEDDQDSFESLEDDIAGQGTRFDESDEDTPVERHPLLQKATDFYVGLDKLFPEGDPPLAPLVRTLYQGAGEAVGGLAQALSNPDEDALDQGLRLVQLKRALRGVAFARGAVFPLRSTLGKEQSDKLFATLEELASEIVSEIGKVRSKLAADDSI